MQTFAKLAANRAGGEFAAISPGLARQGGQTRQTCKHGKPAWSLTELGGTNGQSSRSDGDAINNTEQTLQTHLLFSSQPPKIPRQT
jgi:hypothetical protein